MINNKPSKAVEKSWLATIAEYGCVITGSDQIQLHHVVGREGKHNKYHIGRLFVIPLHVDLHDRYGSSPYNVTNHKKAFVGRYDLQSRLFQEMVQCMELDGIEIPISEDEMAAIMDTKA